VAVAALYCTDAEELMESVEGCPSSQGAPVPVTLWLGRAVG
jgi:hypothetical protein